MNILGVDLGHHSIKAILLTKGFTKSQPVRAFELPREAEPLEKQLETLLSLVGVKLDSLVLSIPRDSVVTRNITLPFKDKKTIKQTYWSAAEPVLPFPLRDCSTDYYIASIAETEESRIVVFAIRKEDLAPHQALLDSQKIADRFLMVDGLAAVNSYLDTAGPAPTGDVAVLDIGRSRSCLDLLRKGKPCFSRTLSLGGEQLTLAIMERLTLDRDRAEKLKCHLGDPTEIEDQDLITRAHAAMRPVLNRLAQEIRVSLISARDTWRDLEVSKIHIVGGGAALADLPRFLGETLKLEVEPYRPPLLERVPGVDPQRPPLAAYGLALYALNRGEIKIDFLDRPRNFFRLYRKNILAAVSAIALYLGYVFFSYQSELSSLSEKRESIESEVNRALTRATEVMKKPVNLAKIDEVLDEAQKKMDILQSDRVSPMKILDDLSASVPQGIPFVINDFDMSGGNAVVNAKSDTFDTVQKIQAILKERHPRIQLDQYQTDPRDRSVMFRMTLPLDGWESGAGAGGGSR